MYSLNIWYSYGETRRLAIVGLAPANREDMKDMPNGISFAPWLLRVTLTLLRVGSPGDPGGSSRMALLAPEKKGPSGGSGTGVAWGIAEITSRLG